MGKLMSNEMSAMLLEIERIESIEEMLRIVKQIDALKIALESVDAFRAKAVMYARLEAEALLKVVKLGGASKLRGYHGKTAKWLAELSEEEKEKYISMCSEGLTIDQVFKREVGNDERLSKKIEDMNMRRDWLLDDLKETGVADMTEYCAKAREMLPFGLANDIIDGTRNRIRKAGGVSVGEGSLTYIAKDSGDKDGVKKAIRLRFESIHRDYESVKEIARTSGIKMSWKELYDFSGWTLQNEPVLSHLLIAFAQIGVVSDQQTMYDALEIEDVRREIEYIERTLKLSRDRIIELKYQGIQDRKAVENKNEQT